MNTLSHTLYACPVCQQPLSFSGNSLLCSNQHNFDRHKKGYINLLLAHQKSSKAPGDDSDMVKGRRAFLRAHHYQPFANAIVHLARLATPQANQPLSVLDAGCGEGYYTEHLQQALATPHMYGLDISKPAITAAASNKHIHWSVASSSRLPFISHSLDLIVSIFSRIEQDAFLQALKPQGYILYAGPGDNHLPQLRNIIYNEVTPYSSNKHKQYFDRSMTLVKEQSLQISIKLDSHDEIMQLVSMTPHAHRISKEGRKRLKHTQYLQDTGDFKLYLYQRNITS